MPDAVPGAGAEKSLAGAWNGIPPSWSATVGLRVGCHWQLAASGGQHWQQAASGTRHFSCGRPLGECGARRGDGGRAQRV